MGESFFLFPLYGLVEAPVKFGSKKSFPDSRATLFQSVSTFFVEVPVVEVVDVLFECCVSLGLAMVHGCKGNSLGLVSLLTSGLGPNPIGSRFTSRRLVRVCLGGFVRDVWMLGG